MAEEYWKRLCRPFNERYVREIETRLQEKTHDSSYSHGFVRQIEMNKTEE